MYIREEYLDMIVSNRKNFLKKWPVSYGVNKLGANVVYTCSFYCIVCLRQLILTITIHERIIILSISVFVSFLNKISSLLQTNSLR